MPWYMPWFFRWYMPWFFRQCQKSCSCYTISLLVVQHWVAAWIGVKHWQSYWYLCTQEWSNLVNRDVPEVLVSSKCRPQFFNIEFGNGSHSQNNYISVLYAQSALLETHAHSIGCVQRHSGVGFFVATGSKADLPACLLQSVQLALPERQKALTCFQRNCCQFFCSKFDPSTLFLFHFHVTSWYVASYCFQHSGPTKYPLHFPFGFG